MNYPNSNLSTDDRLSLETGDPLPSSRSSKSEGQLAREDINRWIEQAKKDPIAWAFHCMEEKKRAIKNAERNLY
jgi:hypothetical protein